MGPVGALSERAYIGELREVSFSDAAGAVHTVAVYPVALSVDADGLCTSPTRAHCDKGLDYDTSGDHEWFSLTELVYYRRRKAGPMWYHEINGGRLALVDRGYGPPVALLDVPTAQRCDGAGDYICGG